VNILYAWVVDDCVGLQYVLICSILWC